MPPRPFLSIAAKMVVFILDLYQHDLFASDRFTGGHFLLKRLTDGLVSVQRPVDMLVITGA